jgi:RNA polymerase sigma factor (sigma-70 family)
MANGQMNGVLRHLRRVALRHDGGGMTDGQLLERFLTAREEAAFEALVRRHGPMVLGVCRRVLIHLHDAEDAFQATFLVMVRKASSMVARETVGNWLYGVAFRTAQKARAAAARRRVKEKQMSRPEALEEDVWRELRPLLDQELNRLPDKYRDPVILCDVEGNTRKEAARRLGWPEGTLSGRLSRARVLLAKRLARHGLTLSGGAVAVILSQNAASACVPAPLVSSTVQAAALVAAGHAAAGVVSAPVAALTEGVMKAMLMTKLKIATAVVLAVGLLGIGFGLYQTQASAAPDGKKEVGKPPAGGAPAVGAPAREEEKTDDDAKDDEKINLPKGAAPIQVLASLDKDGKLVVKTAVMTFRVIGVPGGPAAPLPVAPPAIAPPGGVGFGGGAGGGAVGGVVVGGGKVKMTTTIQSQTYDLDDVQILDTKGKKIDKKELAKLLKEEIVAMASQWGQPVDPLHLRVLKEGTLTFILPMPKPGVAPGFPGIAPPGVPVPLPAPLPPGALPPPPAGGFPGAPGAVPPPLITPAPPATPAVPAPPTKKDPSKP